MNPNLFAERGAVTYANGKASRHPVKIIGMIAHSHHLGDDFLASPLGSKNLSKLLEILCRSLTDRKDGIAQPAHAQAAQLLVEEFNAQLASQQRDILDNSQPHSPLFVFCQLNDGRE